MAVDPPSKESILSAMSATDTLRGWDVLVVYDEKKVNEILSFRASETPGVLDGLGEFEATGYSEKIPSMPFDL